MGEPVDCLLSDVEQILEDTLHVDNVQYVVEKQQSEFQWTDSLTYHNAPCGNLAR